MTTFFNLMALLFWAASLFVFLFALASGALREIEALIMFLISSLFAVGAALLYEIIEIKKAILKNQPSISPTEALPINTANLTDHDLMQEYGVVFDGEKYHFNNYTYDKLNDAIEYAKKKSKPE